MMITNAMTCTCGSKVDFMADLQPTDVNMVMKFHGQGDLSRGMSRRCMTTVSRHMETWEMEIAEKRRRYRLKQQQGSESSRRWQPSSLPAPP